MAQVQNGYVAEVQNGYVPNSTSDSVAYVLTILKDSPIMRDPLFPKNSGDTIRFILGQLRIELMDLQQVSCRLEQELGPIGPEAQSIRLVMDQVLMWKDQLQVLFKQLIQQAPFVQTLLTSTPMGQYMSNLQLEKMFSTCTSMQDINGVLIPLIENLTLMFSQLRQSPLYVQLEPMIQQVLPALTNTPLLQGKPLIQFKPFLQGFSMTVQQWCPQAYPALRTSLCGFENTIRTNPVLKTLFGYQ